MIKEEDTVQDVFFMIDGCLRSFCSDKNGKEHTLQFAIKDWLVDLPKVRKSKEDLITEIN